MTTQLPQASAANGQAPSMPPQADQLLNQLNDVIAPGDVSIWPLAPGWWVLMVWAVVAVVGLCLWFIRRRAGNRYRKAAINELVNLKFEQSPQFVSTISSLLKRAVLSCAPESRALIGNLHGQTWVNFLNTCCAKPVIKGDPAAALAEQQYSPTLSVDIADLKAQVLQWVNQHKTELVQREIRKIKQGYQHNANSSETSSLLPEVGHNV